MWMGASAWMLTVLEVVFLPFRGIFGPQDACKKYPRHWAVEFWRDAAPFSSRNEEYQHGDTEFGQNRVLYTITAQ